MKGTVLGAAQPRVPAHTPQGEGRSQGRTVGPSARPISQWLRVALLQLIQVFLQLSGFTGSARRAQLAALWSTIMLYIIAFMLGGIFGCAPSWCKPASPGVSSGFASRALQHHPGIQHALGGRGH